MTTYDIHSAILACIKLFENRDDDKGYRAAAVIRTEFDDMVLLDCDDPLRELALKQLESAIESRFWVSVCDVLEYEILPIIDRTREEAYVNAMEPR